MVWAGALAAPVLMALIINGYGVNVPYWDEWDQLAVVAHAYDHTLDVSLLWEQQNEHRPITSKIISIILARTTNLNLVTEMYLGFGFQVVSLILIWHMLAAGLRHRSGVLIGPLTIAASLMLFWAVAHEDWIWGLASVQYFLSTLCAVFGVWALTRFAGKWTGVLIASAVTTVAIFTTGCGFALIGVGILATLGSGLARRRVRWLHLLVFVLLSGACTAIYLRGYISPGYSATSFDRLHPIEMGRYFLTYVGSPFWFRSAAYRSCLLFGLAGTIGIAGAAYYVILRGRELIATALPWILLASYTLINGVDTAFARIGYGVEQATASRYRPVAILFWISLTVLLSIVGYEARDRVSRRVVRATTGAAVALFIAGYSLLYYRGFGALTRHSEYVAAGISRILNYEQASDADLQMYHPTPSVVRELCRKLDQYHLGPFSGGR